jgi:hypothetical protein
MLEILEKRISDNRLRIKNLPVEVTLSEYIELIKEKMALYKGNVFATDEIHGCKILILYARN